MEFSTLEWINNFVAIGFLLPIAWQDYKEKRIPNKLLFVWLTVRGLLFLWEGIQSPEQAMTVFIGNVITMVVVIGIFGITRAISRGGIGMGDIKLFAVLSFAFGFRFVMGAVLYSSLTAALVGGVLLLLKKADKKSRLPFAPFILTGTVLTMFFTGV